MKLLITTILFCVFAITPSVLKGQEKEIYLPSIFLIKDTGKIQVNYDEEKRVVSINSSVSWYSYTKDSTYISIDYDAKGRIIQKRLSTITFNKDSVITPMILRESVYIYNYANQDTISVSFWLTTKSYGDEEEGSVQQNFYSAQIYTDADKNIIENYTDKKGERLSFTKTKYNLDGTVSEYFHSVQFMKQMVQTTYSNIEFVNNKSIFENVNFENNYNRTQLINIFLLPFDRVSKMHLKSESVFDDKNTITEEDNCIRYECNEAGYPVYLQMEKRTNQGEIENDPDISIEYINIE